MRKDNGVELSPIPRGIDDGGKTGVRQRALTTVWPALPWEGRRVDFVKSDAR